MPQRQDRDHQDDDAQQCDEDSDRLFPPSTTSALTSQSTARWGGQTSMPNLRAERCRWRLARRRRSRFTSIGSAASAAGVSINALSTW